MSELASLSLRLADRLAGLGLAAAAAARGIHQHSNEWDHATGGEQQPRRSRRRGSPLLSDKNPSKATVGARRAAAAGHGQPHRHLCRRTRPTRRRGRQRRRRRLEASNGGGNVNLQAGPRGRTARRTLRRRRQLLSILSPRSQASSRLYRPTAVLAAMVLAALCWPR